MSDNPTEEAQPSALAPGVCPHCHRALVSPADDPPDEQDSGVVAPTFDNPETRQFILDSMEAGASLEVSAGAAGIHKRQITRWLAKGRDQRDRRRSGKWRAFLEQVELTQAKCEHRYVSIVANAAIDDPNMAMSILERKFPERWTPRISVLVEQDRKLVLDAIVTEFANEPKILERILLAVTASARGDEALRGELESPVPRAPRPRGIEEGVLVPVAGVGGLHSEADAEVPATETPAADVESADEDGEW